MKFFVVDDDPDALSLVDCLLVKAGHEVITLVVPVPTRCVISLVSCPIA